MGGAMPYWPYCFPLVSNPYFTVGTVVLVLLILFLNIGIKVHEKKQNASRAQINKNKFPTKANDKTALDKLLRRVNQLGNINDENTPRPLVTLEEFFIGNSDYGSIGYNWGPDQPSPQEFYELFQDIREKPGVHDVLVLVNDQVEPGDWPSTDTVWIITSAGVDDIKDWLGRRFFADDLLIGFPEAMKIEEAQIPVDMNAIGVWWD
jgi:hypothetical protein